MSAIFTESTHGKRQLCYIGYRYSLKPTSYLDLSVIVRENHTHLPDETDKEVLEMRQNLKRKATEESSPIDRIVEEAFHAINSQSQSNDLLIDMPAIATIKNTLQKQRPYCKTKQGESFLLYDGPLGGVRSLVFSSCNDMAYLSQHENWYDDGTFYTCPSIFYQMYSIHTYYDGISTPCIFALLTGKNEQIYTDLFTVVFKKMFQSRLPIRLRTITINFELAVNIYNVFTKNDPTVVVRGCLFHYGQSLFRKFVDLGLTTAYKNDENLRESFRSFAALSLLPFNHMLWGFIMFNSYSTCISRH
ncbi:unnamed protein product [Rotaria socialis]|uniref:MULE transposase domain-containing protein n=2 Tax=Rotaria socialis TaxID=392032 RepID=A0A821LKB7_9BILA|nr:unnamed protein product [Rotaria socialis]